MFDQKKYEQKYKRWLRWMLFLALLIVGCRRERLQTTVVTPTTTATLAASTVVMDPTIAAVLAQVTVTPTAEITLGPPTQTPEFICEPPEGWILYTVQPNDTLFAISATLSISVGDIKDANCRLDDALSIGDTIYLPQFPANQQPPPINSQPFPPIDPGTIEGIPQELAFSPGGGDIRLECSFSDFEDKAILVDMSKDPHLLPAIEIAICDPAMVNISLTLEFPTGENISLSRDSSPFYISFELPLGHPYGMYTVIMNDYPESGMIEEIQLQIDRGPPTLLDGSKVYLYYFEPNEIVHLLIYQAISEESVEFVTSKSYTINPEGFLIVDVDQKFFYAALGEKSGFAGGKLFPTLEIKNNGSESICQIMTRATGTIEWLNSTITPLETGKMIRKVIGYGNYDIEMRNCNEDIVYQKNNIEVHGITRLEVP